MTRAFFDTNILVYAFNRDPAADKARSVIVDRGCISVQCLNEFAAVARRKLGFDWSKLDEAIHWIRSNCDDVVKLDLPIHDDGRRVAERYRLSVYDGMIVAAALSAGCDTLYSEDMHGGLLIDGRLRIVNPFAPTAVHPPR